MRGLSWVRFRTVSKLAVAQAIAVGLALQTASDRQNKMEHFHFFRKIRATGTLCLEDPILFFSSGPLLFPCVASKLSFPSLRCVPVCLQGELFYRWHHETMRGSKHTLDSTPLFLHLYFVCIRGFVVGLNLQTLASVRRAQQYRLDTC